MSTRTIHWTEDTKTMMIRTDIPGFFIEFGQQMVVRVKNDTESQINLGTVVFFNGSENFPTLAIADYSSYLTSEGTLGFVAHNMLGNTEGYVITKGILRYVDLTNFSDGDDIYLYTGGTFTNIKPIAPLPEVYLGTVIKSGENGILNVNIELGFELEELHNVKIDNLSNNDFLVWDEEFSVWKNKQVSLNGSGGSSIIQRNWDYVSPYFYAGSSEIGTSTSSNNWTIKKIDYTVSGLPVITQTTGSWNNRYSLTYT